MNVQSCSRVISITVVSILALASFGAPAFADDGLAIGVGAAVHAAAEGSGAPQIGLGVAGHAIGYSIHPENHFFVYGLGSASAGFIDPFAQARALGAVGYLQPLGNRKFGFQVGATGDANYSWAAGDSSRVPAGQPVPPIIFTHSFVGGQSGLYAILGDSGATLFFSAIAAASAENLASGGSVFAPTVGGNVTVTGQRPGQGAVFLSATALTPVAENQLGKYPTTLSIDAGTGSAGGVYGAIEVSDATSSDQGNNNLTLQLVIGGTVYGLQ